MRAFQMVEPATGEFVIVCNEGHRVNHMSWSVSIVSCHYVTEDFVCLRKTFALNASFQPNKSTGCRNWKTTAQCWRKRNWPSRIVKLPWPICIGWSPKNNPWNIIPYILIFVWLQEKRGWRALEGQSAIEADGFVMIRVFHPCFPFSCIELAS